MRLEAGKTAIFNADQASYCPASSILHTRCCRNSSPTAATEYTTRLDHKTTRPRGNRWMLYASPFLMSHGASAWDRFNTTATAREPISASAQRVMAGSEDPPARVLALSTVGEDGDAVLSDIIRNERAQRLQRLEDRLTRAISENEISSRRAEGRPPLACACCRQLVAHQIAALFLLEVNEPLLSWCRRGLPARWLRALGTGPAITVEDAEETPPYPR